MSWVLMALRGAVALARGVEVLVARRGEDRLATFIAVYFVLAGLDALASARAAHVSRGRRLRRSAGIVSILLAVFVLTRETLAGAIPTSVVFGLLGVGMIAIGGMRLGGGFTDEEARQEGRHRPSATDIALGIAEVVLGAALTTDNFDEIWPAMAIWGIVGGTALLLDARRRRNRTSNVPRETTERDIL